MTNKKKFELDEEDLDEVLGGVSYITELNGCEYFFPLVDGICERNCSNCFYHHKDENGKDYCSEQHH